jgi:hypothetical protein
MLAAFPPGLYLCCLESLVKLHYFVVLRRIHIACHEQNTKSIELFVVTCGVLIGSYSCNMLPVIVTLQVSHVLRTLSLHCFNVIKCCQTLHAASFFIFEIDCFVAGSFLIVKEKQFFLFGWGGNNGSLLFCVMYYALKEYLNN